MDEIPVAGRTVVKILHQGDQRGFVPGGEMLEGGAPAPPRGPVFLTFGAYEPESAFVSARTSIGNGPAKCGIALQEILRVSRKISEIRD